MEILYLTTPDEDYLQDQILIGLRSLFGTSVIDFPKKEKLYNNCSIPSKELYGNGFTIWKTLDDISINRDDALNKLQSGHFDFIIFGSIFRQIEYFEMFQKHNFFNSNNNFIFLDGEDHFQYYSPALGLGKYFKRELMAPIKGIEKISFSIPSKKIITTTIPKKKKFTKHVQCEEAYKIDEIKNNCTASYAFSNESEYYKDIAESLYGFTMKKGGWDCMRHYEIAANGTVPCFYKFDEKPLFSAPHDLFDMKNIISFSTAEELKAKLKFIEESNLYESLQSNILEWIHKYTCENIVQYIIN